MLIFYDNIILTQRQISTTVSEICAKTSNLFYIRGVQLSTYLPLGFCTCYRSQRFCKGYVFTPVCLSTGGGLPQCMLGWHTPQKQTPPRSRHPPRSRPPLEQTPAGEDPPSGADPNPPWSRHPHRTRLLLRTVRILLECILVNFKV